LTANIPFVYADVVQAMLDPKTGVKVQDRSYLFRSYPQCFVASEMVDWILSYHKTKENKVLTRQEGVEFGDLLRAAGIFAHVVDPHTLSDQYLFFRFQVSRTSKVLGKDEFVEEIKPSTHLFKVLDMDKKEVDLSVYKGKVCLFVNVASY
jgi:hypothetical protein